MPFAVDDYDAAREAFARWHRSQSRLDLQTLEVWCYGYALSYFHGQFKRERTGGASDIDAAVTQAVDRLFRSLPTVREPLRFPNYVSRVCRNVLLTHRSRRRDTVEITDRTVSVVPSEAEGYDLILVRRLVARAIDALPPAIRRVARLRILEQTPYSEIAEATGLPIDSVRTYASKAAARLRCDPILRDLLDEH